MKEDLTGRKFQRLLVVSRVQNPKKPTQKTWLCRCDCGVECFASSNELTRGARVSCGCQQREKVKAQGLRNVKHGHTKDGKIPPEYRSWADMLTRCYNPNQEHYKNYGGRGITVCDRWRNSFPNFWEDMGAKPNRSYTIERDDVNGNYEPTNCRWASMITQQRNRRNNRVLEYHGESKCVAEWAEILKVNQSKLWRRLEMFNNDMEKVVETINRRFSTGKIRRVI